ncbi:hypothetical protein BH24CHL10_BH24CHL10_08840 [soil metagenome]
MQRPRLFAPLFGLLATAVVGPMFATAALAADPSVTVKPGDTLTSISKRHHVSIATLVDLNELPHPNRIYAGQRLRVTSNAAKAAPAATSKPEVARTHVVKRGQNLTEIARRYDVTVSAIVRANEIKNASRIYAGQRLAIPGTSPSAATKATKATKAPKPAASATHKVARGEILTTIARAYSISVSALVKANGITNPSRIYAGQRLTIPGKSAAPKGSKAAAPERATLPASMRALMAKRETVRRTIVEEARRYDVPAAFALAVAWQESGWQQGVVSHAGAVGVMQLMPATAEWVGDVMLGTPVQIRDTRHNVRAGVRLLAHYLAHYDGDRARVLAAYYQGQWATDHHGIYPVSRPYIASIKVLERLFDD